MKNTPPRGYTIAGATALFVGLAGTVHAIPISSPDDLNAGLNEGNWSQVQTQFETARASDQFGHRQIFVSFTPSFLFPALRAKSAGESLGFGLAQYHQEIHSAPRISSLWTSHPGATASVPDAASTALLIGIAFGGLLLLPRKLNA